MLRHQKHQWFVRVAETLHSLSALDGTASPQDHAAEVVFKRVAATLLYESQVRLRRRVVLRACCCCRRRNRRHSFSCNGHCRLGLGMLPWCDFYTISSHCRVGLGCGVLRCVLLCCDVM